MFVCLRILGLLLLMALGAGPAAAAWPTDPTTNLPVCLAGGDQGPPRAVSDAADGILIAWQDARAGGQIYAQHFDATGATLWMADGIPLGPAGATSDPMIVTDGSGGAVIAWIEDSGSARTLKAQRLDGGGNEQWASGGVVLRARVDQPNPPNDSSWLWDQATAAADGAGGIFVCFQERHQEDNAVDPSRYSSQLRMLRCDGSGAVVDDRVLAADQYICSFCGDGYFHLDEFSDLTLSAGEPAGLVVAYRARTIINHGVRFNPPEIRALEPIAGWSATVVTAAADVRHPRIASDEGGGAIVSWEDTRGGGPRLYAARVNAAGGMPWTASGVPVSAGGGDQFHQEMSALQGGAVLAWLDLRNGSVPDVYAQRLSGLGAPQWGAGDVALCVQPTLETDLSLVVCADGSTALAWRDTRSGTGDVYGRFVSPTGVTYGSADGDPIGSAAGDQSAPVLEASGTQAIASWMDRRGASADVYAQRIGLAGPVSGVPESGEVAGLRLSPLVPNPTPGQATIRFTLPLAMSATMRIYDLGGRLVRFVGTGVLPAGAHVVHWDGRDSEARALPNGLYLVVLEAQGRRLARRLVVVR